MVERGGKKISCFSLYIFCLDKVYLISIT
jgi:hypothetical protein